MPQIVFKRGRAAEWTLERIGQLTVSDIKQLRENAERLNEPEVVAWCSQALKEARPRSAVRVPGKRTPGTQAESADGGCRYRLWAPNVDGSQPWSDTPPGRERLDHCKRAMEVGRAEGLLVYGQRLAGHLPEDKAHAVHGVDAETVLVFQVEQHGAEFWASWGRKAAASTIERG